MTKGAISLIALVVLSLVLQNTCMYGFESRTAFVSKMTHDCPFKDEGSKETGKHDNVKPDISRVYASYVTHSTATLSAVVPLPSLKMFHARSPEQYTDAVIEPSIRPPIV